MSRVLTVRLERRFTPAMEAVRRGGWATGPTASACDEFDEVSAYLTVSQAATPVAMVRITIGGRSVLATWSRGRAPLSHGPDIAELTRAVVVEPLRRLGLYRLAMLESVLRLRALGARMATAAIEPEFPGRRFLADLGFAPVGVPVLFDDHPRSHTLAQSILLMLDARGESRWRELRHRQIELLLAAGFAVDSDLPAPGAGSEALAHVTGTRPTSEAPEPAAAGH